MKIWFDILTPKQYLFFEYFIQKLRKQHKIISTSRKYEQVNGITKFGTINPIIIGKHGGKNNIDKLLASLDRTKLLTKKIERDKPDLLVSFCSPEGSRVAYGLGIPHIAFSDSPHAKAVMKLSLPYVTKLLTPNIIPKSDFKEFGINSRNIIHIDLVFNENNQEIKNFESFFENLSLSTSEFRLILIGKDGGIKLNSRKTSLGEIFSLIDTMPMRQEEMLNDKC